VAYFENLDIDIDRTETVITNTIETDVLHSSDYYPFGLRMVKNSAPSVDYRYGYQGDFAEEDKETGFNHFEAREYDPVIGRWMVMDPARQYYSGYLGMGNNPINGVDPDGEYFDLEGSFGDKFKFWTSNILISLVDWDHASRFLSTAFSSNRQEVNLIGEFGDYGHYTNSIMYGTDINNLEANLDEFGLGVEIDNVASGFNNIVIPAKNNESVSYFNLYAMKNKDGGLFGSLSHEMKHIFDANAGTLLLKQQSIYPFHGKNNGPLRLDEADAFIHSNRVLKRMNLFYDTDISIPNTYR
jgi:RHS repeat-associated protein